MLPNLRSKRHSRAYARCRSFVLAVLAIASAAHPQQSQQQPAAEPPAAVPQKPAISVQVKVVNVFATVRNQHGDIVFTLGKDDFVLEQDGHEQAITYFAQESDLPLTLGLLVDTSLSQRNVLSQERTASYSFLDHLLREERDKAFLIHFDHEVELLQDLTASRDKLEHALSLLGTPQWGSGGTSGSGGGGRRYPQEERPDGKKVLKQISTETGARLFEVSKKLLIDQIYAQIAQELRSQYSLGYTPAGSDASPGYHRLTLRTKQKDMTVQARTGFYSEP